MNYIKCGSCNCYKSIDYFGCRKSGLPYKCCNKCRSKKPKSTIKADDTDTKKISIDKADEIDDNKNIVLEIL